MTLIRHELRQGGKALAVWTVSIGFLMAVCIFLFPEMKGEMDIVTEMFASMGSFSAAFGMDRLSFGTLTGFYAVECGNILGLGGAFFASLVAVSALAKEEKDRTAEFLLTHPVSRWRVITGKLAAVLLQIVLLNALVFGLAIASVAAIGEELPWKELALMHLAYFLMQVELAGVCFGISAFLRRGGLGVGLGLAAVMYFLSIIANISESAEFLQYVTPFAYTEGADIVENGSLDAVLVGLGMLYALLGVAAAYWKYSKKDIR
ncbi:MAG: ABC transporter permease subunit [Oscillospiraceae bacterium]